MPHAALAPQAVTIPAAAVLIGVSEQTIRRRIADGTIKVGSLGARVLVPIAELERVLGRAIVLPSAPAAISSAPVVR